MTHSAAVGELPAGGERLARVHAVSARGLGRLTRSRAAKPFKLARPAAWPELLEWLILAWPGRVAAGRLPARVLVRTIRGHRGGRALRALGLRPALDAGAPVAQIAFVSHAVAVVVSVIARLCLRRNIADAVGPLSTATRLLPGGAWPPCPGGRSRPVAGGEELDICNSKVIREIDMTYVAAATTATTRASRAARPQRPRGSSAPTPTCTSPSATGTRTSWESHERRADRRSQCRGHERALGPYEQRA